MTGGASSTAGVVSGVGSGKDRLVGADAGASEANACAKIKEAKRGNIVRIKTPGVETQRHGSVVYYALVKQLRQAFV